MEVATEAAAHWIGEYLLEELYCGVDDVPDGNQVPNAAPHDAYPCKGHDEWVAIAVRSEGEWHRLCAVMGRRDLARDGRYSSVASRLRFNAELDGQIAAWTSMRDKEDAAVALQAAGVPAAPVNNGRDISGDPALRAAGFVARLDHPDAGTHEYPWCRPPRADIRLDASSRTALRRAQRSSARWHLGPGRVGDRRAIQKCCCDR